MIHESKAEVAASAIAGSAVFQPAAAVTDVIIPHSVRPSLTYSRFIYPHSQNPCFTQVLCLWASFQGRSAETTQRLSRLSFETCSRLLARKPTVPTLSVEKTPQEERGVGMARPAHRVPFPCTLGRRLAMQWALVDGHAFKSQVQGAANRGNCRNLVSVSTHCSDSLPCPFCNLPLSAKRV